MTILVYISTLLMNMIYAFRKKHSRIVILITFVVIILLMGGAGPDYNPIYQSRDYFNYEVRYNDSNNNYTRNFGLGYNLLMQLGNFLNLDFFLFRILIISIVLGLVYKLVVKRYVKNSNYVLLMYLIYPMVIDSEHFRNFIALSIFLIGIRFLENDNIRSKIKYILTIALASSFHFSFLFYTVLIFANTKNRNRLAKSIGIITAFLVIITIVNNNQIPFIGLFLNLFEDERVLSYISTKTKMGFVIPMMLHISSIILVSWSRKIIKTKTNLLECESNSTNSTIKKKQLIINEVDLSNLIFWINIVSIVFFPLFIMNLQFDRIIRNILILNFVSYSMASSKLKSRSVYKNIFNFSIILSLVLWVIMDLVLTTSPERVIIPFFTQNAFLN